MNNLWEPILKGKVTDEEVDLVLQDMVSHGEAILVKKGKSLRENLYKFPKNGITRCMIRKKIPIPSDLVIPELL